VVDAGVESWREAPEFEGHSNRDFIQGLLESDGRIVIVLRTEALDDLSNAGADIAA